MLRHSCPWLQVWTKAEVLAKRLEVDQMTGAQREAFDETWSKENAGQWFGYFPAVPYHHVVTDMLHLNLNQWNDAITEAFHSHLDEKQYTEADVKTMVAATTDKLNARIKASGLGFRFDEKAKALNGPKLKDLIRAGDLLIDMVEIMEPLYNLREAKDHPAVKPKPLSPEELEAATAAAAEAAAAAPPKKATGRPVKAKRRGGFSVNRPVVLPAAAAREGDQTRGGAGEAGPGGPAGMPACGECAQEGAGDAAGSRDAGDESAPITYKDRVCTMFYMLMEMWTFTHQHQHDTSKITPDMRKQRAVEAGKIGRATELAMLECIGTKRRRTYGHDTIYGIPHLFLLLGKPYLGATEGNEHAHQDMKKYFSRMASKSSKKYPAVQQVMDMLIQKQYVCSQLAGDVRRNHQTQIYTGMAVQPKQPKKQRTSADVVPARRDDAIEDTKTAILARTGPIVVHKADRRSLDPNIQEMLLFREHQRQEAEEMTV